MKPLSLDIQLRIARTVAGRILNTPWEQLATQLKCPVAELEALPFLYPDEWHKQMNTASADHQKASVNQALQALTRLMQGDDAKANEKAAATMARLINAQERAEQRRLKEIIPTPNTEAVPEPEATMPRDTEPQRTSPPINRIPPQPAPTPNAPNARRDHNGIPLLC